MKKTEFAFSRADATKRYEIVEVPYVSYVDDSVRFTYFLRIYDENGSVVVYSVEDFKDAIYKIEKDYMEGRYAMGELVQDAKKEKEDIKEDIIVDAQTELMMEETSPRIIFNGDVKNVYINYTQNNFQESGEGRDEE